MELLAKSLTDVLKRRLVLVGVNPSGYARKSFRIGIACTALENQGGLQGGKGGVFYANAHIEYVERVGRWTISE